MTCPADDLVLEAHRWRFAVRERAETWHSRAFVSHDAHQLVAAFDTAAEILTRAFEPPGLPPLGGDLADPAVCAEAKRWGHALRTGADRLRAEPLPPGQRLHALRLADTLEDVARLFRVRSAAGATLSVRE